MVHGLDIGPEAIRSVADGAEGVSASVPPVVRPIDGPSRESVGDSSGTAPTIERDGTVYVVGTNEPNDDATTPLFADGHLVDEAYAEPALVALLETVLDDDPVGALCWTTTARPGASGEPTRVRRALETATADAAVDPTPIDRGLAVVYDQFSADVDGLGCCLGAQTTTVALTADGAPATTVTVEAGRDRIVDRAVERTGGARERVVALETVGLDAVGDADEGTSGDLERALAREYDDLFADLAAGVAEAVDHHGDELGRPVPLAVGGAGAVPGAESLLRTRLREECESLSIGDVRLADDPAASPVRGALVAARDDVDATAAATGDRSCRPAVGPDRDGGGTTVTFDENAVRGSGPTTEAGDAAHLLDRLERRESEVRSVGERAADLLTDLEDVEDRSTATDRSLEERLTAVAADLAAIERDRAGGAVETLERNVDALADDLTALRARAGETDPERLAAIERHLDALAGAVDDIDRATTIDDRDGRRRVVADALARVESIRSSVVDDVALVEDCVVVLRDRLNDLRTDLRVTTADLEDDVATAESRTATLEDRLDDLAAELASVGADVAALGDRGESTSDGGGPTAAAPDPTVDGRASRPDDRTDRDGDRATAERLSRLEERLAAVEDRVDEGSALRPETTAARDRSRAAPALAAPAVAGAGGAGIVAGGVAVLSRQGAIGAGATVLGVTLLVGAALLVRRGGVQPGRAPGA